MKKTAVVGAAVVIVTTALALAVSAETKKGMAFPKDWPSYKHIGSLVITDKNNGLFGFHHFYINNKGVEAFEKGAKYPDGTVIFDAVYELKQDEAVLNEGKLAFFPVMKKNSKMTETGGWEWAAFSPDGKLLDKDPKKDCFSCHEAMKDSDYVFSKPLK
jgi:hypothetical protein